MNNTFIAQNKLIMKADVCILPLSTSIHTHSFVDYKNFSFVGSLCNFFFSGSSFKWSKKSQTLHVGVLTSELLYLHHLKKQTLNTMTNVAHAADGTRWSLSPSWKLSCFGHEVGVAEHSVRAFVITKENVQQTESFQSLSIQR